MNNEIAKQSLIQGLDHDYLGSSSMARNFYCLTSSEYFTDKIQEKSNLRNLLEVVSIDNTDTDNFQGEDGLHIELEQGEKAYWLNFDENRKEKITPESNKKEEFIHFFSIASPQYKIPIDKLAEHEDKKEQIFNEIENTIVDGLVDIENENMCKSLGVDVGNLDKILPPYGLMLMLANSVGVVNTVERDSDNNKYLRFMAWENASVLLADKNTTKSIESRLV